MKVSETQSPPEDQDTQSGSRWLNVGYVGAIVTAKDKLNHAFQSQKDPMKVPPPEQPSEKPVKMPQDPLTKVLKSMFDNIDECCDYLDANPPENLQKRNIDAIRVIIRIASRFLPYLKTDIPK